MKNLDVWGKDAFHTAIFLQMVSPLMVHGTSKNHFTCNGNNGIAKVIVVIIVCWIEREKEKHLVMILSSTMVNGPSGVYMEFRFGFLVVLFSLAFSFLLRCLRSILLFEKTYDLLFMCSGACFCCFLCP